MRKHKIHNILTFLKRCKALETTERYKVSMSKNRNTVAEHSWRLALMVLIIATECKIRIDMNRALSLSLLHDIAESETGDIDAIEQIKGGDGVLRKKSEMEEIVMRKMTRDVSFGDWIFNMWQEYEDQRTIEAKFVKALDKIEGFLHISEVGVEAYIPKEFHADYANKAVEAFDEATYHFPELKDLLDVIKANLKIQFDKVGVKWIDEK